MTALETLAGHWVDEHPEYFPDLEDADAALQRDYSVESGKTNPFLHLSMHLTISEQCSIDQPHGVRPALEKLAHRLGSVHQAQHQAMECLGRMVWESQRNGRPPDGAAYVEQIQRLVTGD